LSVSAAATFERGTVSLSYLDIVLVVLAAAAALALGAPALGLTVGVVAWIAARGASVLVERRLAAVDDPRRRLASGLAYKMARVWVLAGAIIAAGVAGSRPDGLTAALTIFGAFSVFFACSAFAHVTQTRRAGS
jgi:hypothetical protein